MPLPIRVHPRNPRLKLFCRQGRFAGTLAHHHSPKMDKRRQNSHLKPMTAFQIIFTPAGAAELARMPKDLQLQILGEFRGVPHQVMATELEDFGKLERDGRVLHRLRIGDYRIYFEKHDLGVLVHRILSRNTLKDFYFRHGLKVQEDEALQSNPRFWELIENARTASKS